MSEVPFTGCVARRDFKQKMKRLQHEEESALYFYCSLSKTAENTNCQAAVETHSPSCEKRRAAKARADASSGARG